MRGQLLLWLAERQHRRFDGREVELQRASDDRAGLEQQSAVDIMS